MTEINSNYYVSGGNGVNTSVSTVPANNRGYGYPVQQLSLRDEFVKQHKKNGIVERFYNWVKNVTKLGTGSKKAEAAVTQAENGEISEEQARQTINKYRNSQATSAQIVGDIASIGAGSAAFFGLRRLLKMEGAAAILNEQAYKEMAKSTGKDVVEKYTVKLINIAKSNKKMTAILAGTSAIIAGFTKLFLGKFNRIGSQEFKIDKKDFNNLQTERDRAAYKYEKKLNKRAKYRANIKNFISGAVNGALLPITLVGNAVIGVPVYLLGNTLNRYFISGTDENGKSFNGYINNLKNDSITHAALAVGAAIPLIKQGRMANVFDANLKKSFNALKTAKLKESGFAGKTVYQELDDILMHSDNVAKIIDTNERELYSLVSREASNIMNEKGIERSEAWEEAYKKIFKNLDEKITKLTEENIIAVKFKQIANDGSDLSRALRENCPVTHTMEEASEIINASFPGKYKVIKSLGAGTIAETYLAEGPNKEQVCIKILKKGITKEKILADEKKFIDLIDNLPTTQAEKEVLKEAEKIKFNAFKAEKEALIEAEENKFNTIKAEKEALIEKWQNISFTDPNYSEKWKTIRKIEEDLWTAEREYKSLIENIKETEIKAAEEKLNSSLERIEKMELKTKDEKDLLKKNIRNLSEGIQNEVNFEHEMEAAEQLRKSTNVAKVVKGIEVKDNVYVMEKATGISLESFAKINALQSNIEGAKNSLKRNPDSKYLLDHIKQMEKELEIIKEKTPDWEKITKLSTEEASKILDEYQRIRIEQFIKIGNGSKTIHGDIHPGNIFFDVESFKAGKKQYFTLIDTGKTINMTKEQALRALKLTEIVKKGSVPDIAKYVLEGAVLPEGMSYEQALENITSELNKCFFDYETKLPQMTNDSVLDLTSNIMRKYKIIPDDSQLNFNKAKQSAVNSFNYLFEILINKKIGDFDFEEASKTEMVKKGADLATTAVGKFLKYQRMEKIQEKANLALLSPLERRKFKDNPNLLKWTDEKHITYKLKQKIKDVEGIKKEHGLDDIT